MYFSYVEKTGETDFVEKPKSIYGTPFGKVAVPKKWTSSSATHLGGRVTYIICMCISYNKGKFDINSERELIAVLCL